MDEVERKPANPVPIRTISTHISAPRPLPPARKTSKKRKIRKKSVKRNIKPDTELIKDILNALKHNEILTLSGLCKKVHSSPNRIKRLLDFIKFVQRRRIYKGEVRLFRSIRTFYSFKSDAVRDRKWSC